MKFSAWAGPCYFQKPIDAPPQECAPCPRSTLALPPSSDAGPTKKGMGKGKREKGKKGSEIKSIPGTIRVWGGYPACRIVSLLSQLLPYLPSLPLFYPDSKREKGRIRVADSRIEINSIEHPCSLLAVHISLLLSSDPRADPNNRIEWEKGQGPIDKVNNIIGPLACLSTDLGPVPCAPRAWQEKEPRRAREKRSPTLKPAAARFGQTKRQDPDETACAVRVCCFHPSFLTRRRPTTFGLFHSLLISSACFPLAHPSAVTLSQRFHSIWTLSCRCRAPYPSPTSFACQSSRR